MAKSRTQDRSLVAPAPARPCCGHGGGNGESHAGSPESGATRPLHAVAVEADIKEANLKQLRRIEGQIRGIASMIEDERYCADIITQVSAVRESLHSVARNLMRNHIKHCAARAMSAGGKPRDDMVDELLKLVAKVAR
ncbi:MAG: hypothetical protein AMXMBFR58_22120 [Phycisphaerae bacterium]|nr:hypothetical protein [Phycisphaerales bacterium]